jgi:DNA polymerase-3 subunit alpha
MNNLIEPYKTPCPVGVKLPKIHIDKRHYDILGCSPDTSNFNFLRKLCFKGVQERGIDQFSNKQVYYDRLSMELTVLNELGFIDYILLNWDILNFCHETGIPTGAGRGSAAGSLVLYVVGVTNIDPIKYDLFFERFVSKSRAKKIEHNGETFLDGSLLADVDNDISYDRRQEVIDYINRKYQGRTSKILTLNTLSSKLCIKECGKIVGEMSESSVNEISDSIPKKFGKVLKLEQAYTESEVFKSFANKNKKIYRIAKKIEGLAKNTGVHPSGIAISFYELDEIMPIQNTGEDAIVSGYDMNNVAELTVKFDILGLRTLSVIHDVCSRLGIKVNDIDCDHESIYAALQTLQAPQGLFQIEADTNFRVCQKISPKNLEQLSAVVAIARPGALDFMDRYADYARNGQFQSVHPFFDDVLSYTGGIPLYQEQLMKMAVKVGFSLDESEQLRRIVGKKKVDQMGAWKQKIEDKIKENNLDSAVGDVLWKVAEDSANYSFNKSHSISYAYLAAITIYLKFNYPQQFFLSLLKYAQYEPNPHEEINKIAQELSYFNIKLLPPDLAKSDIDFKTEGENIRYGLNSIKGVSTKVLEALLEFREQSFSNKYEVFLAAKQASLNIGVLSALIQAGVLDSFVSKDRCRLVLEAQTFNILTDREKRNIVALGEKYNFDILKTIADCSKEQLMGDDNKRILSEKRFNTFKTKYQPYKEIYEKNHKHLKFANWFFETKLLGYSYSHNVREVFKSEIEGSLVSSNEISNLEENQTVRFVGTVSDIMTRTSANGNKYARMDIFDDLGKLTVLLMDSEREGRLTNYLNSGKVLPKKDSIVIISGKKNRDIVFAEKLSLLEEKIYMKLSEIK